ncbi:MAG: hypothetical protein J3K34DRAFT_504501, partial [Monoraphidium minutum]
MAGSSRGARRGGGLLLPRTLLLVVAAAAALQHASAAGPCQVVISLNSATFAYLNLAEVTLFDSNSAPILTTDLTFTLSSTYPDVDGHLRGFNGAEYAFCDPEHGTGATCNGHVIALLSEAAHLLNARITRLAGPDVWPFAGFWMTALGFRWADVLSIEVEMATDVVYSVKPGAERGDGATRAVVPANWASVFTSAKINGKDVAASIGSGDTLKFGVGAAAASVHFPKGRHPGEPTDGPVMVIATPAMQVCAHGLIEGPLARSRQ